MLSFCPFTPPPFHCHSPTPLVGLPLPLMHFNWLLSVTNYEALLWWGRPELLPERSAPGVCGICRLLSPLQTRHGVERREGRRVCRPHNERLGIELAPGICHILSFTLFTMGLNVSMPFSRNLDSSIIFRMVSYSIKTALIKWWIICMMTWRGYRLNWFFLLFPTLLIDRKLHIERSFTHSNWEIEEHEEERKKNGSHVACLDKPQL